MSRGERAMGYKQTLLSYIARDSRGRVRRSDQPPLFNGLPSVKREAVERGQQVRHGQFEMLSDFLGATIPCPTATSAGRLTDCSQTLQFLPLLRKIYLI
jgi:hypothetical protein